MSELLSSSVALEFVLDLDEAFLSAFAPARLKHMLQDLGELVEPPVQTVRGQIIPWAALALAAVGTLICVVVPVLILPQVTILWEARDALCAGALDFVYTVDTAGMMWWSKTIPSDSPPEFTPWEERAQQHMKSNEDEPAVGKLVRRILSMQPDEIQQGQHSASCDRGVCTLELNSSSAEMECCDTEVLRLASVEAGLLSVGEFAKSTVDTWAMTNNPDCEDLSSLTWYLSLGLTDALGHGDGTCQGGCLNPYSSLCKNGTCRAPMCVDAKPHCDRGTTAGFRARMLCPRTCGCDRPNSTLVLAGPGSGCGSVCQELPRYHSMLSAMPCEDTEPGSEVLLAYATQLRRLAEFWGFHQLGASYYETLTAGCAAWVQKYGERGVKFACGYRPGDQAQNQIGPDSSPAMFKLLTFICPASCKCKAGDYGCPTSCPTV